MSWKTLSYEVDAGVALITLNRPQEGNSLTLELAQELLDVATRCDTSPEVRAVVLTGSGKMFCAGGDLKVFAGQGAQVAAYVKAVTHAMHGAISRFNWMDAPVIVAINGTAAGGGLSLALTADLALAAASAKFTMAYTKAGLVPDCGASYFLSRLIGLRRAKEMVLLNPVLSAEEALAWGLVNRVLPDAEVLPAAMAMARQLAAGSLPAMGEAKRLILAGASESLESQMDRESRAIAAMAGSCDGREGVAAFIEKRPAQFAK